jgi:hypothetical protein
MTHPLLAELDAGSILLVLLYLVVLVIGAVVYFLPTIIAFKRGHSFAWVIFFLNLFGGATGILWVVAAVWAAWPQGRVLTDVVTHDPTGISRRNVGHSAAEIRDAYHGRS